MTQTCSRPSASWATALAVTLALAGVTGEGTAAPAPAAGAAAADATAIALQLLADAMPPEGSAPPDEATRRHLCKLWMSYTRHLKEDSGQVQFRDIHDLMSYRVFVENHARAFGSLGPEMAAADRIAERMIEWEIPCPPDSPALPPPSTTGTGVVGSKTKGSNRTLLLVAGAAGAVGGVVALTAGGGSSGPTPTATPGTTPPVAQPPDVSSLHGMYNGRLVTAAGTISGCGRAATAPCSVTLGGSANGTPATLSFGGDLPNTGTLRPGGALEGLSYQGPANGLGALPAGTVIQWQQQGSVTNGVLRLEGRATVTSAGACNGAVIPTTVEATKN